jgi:4-hydroxybenzoate polyprenyltransferase
MQIADRFPLYYRLLRLDKPVGTLLLLWPTLTALWIAAEGAPSALHVAVFALGTLLMRSAGCAVNDAADAPFDLHVRRTAGRVVARGALDRREALVVGAGLAALAAVLLVFLNAASVRLALLAVLIAATYPLAKRVFPVPQLYLGVAFSFGIPMAFAAVQGEVPLLGWGMFAGNLAWVVAYDTEYAMVDRDDDQRLGIHSAAIYFGRADVAVIMVCYWIFLVTMVTIGTLNGGGWPYFAGCLVAFVLCLQHYWLIRDRSREGSFAAFLGNQWVGLAIFAGTVADFALR